MRIGLESREDKQLRVGSRRAKEGVDIDHDVCRKLNGTCSMVDGLLRIIAHNQGVRTQGFGAIPTWFVQACHTCTKAVSIVQDKHMFPLSQYLSPASVAGDVQEKYTSLALHTYSLRWPVFPQEVSATIRTPGLEQVWDVHLFIQDDHFSHDPSKEKLVRFFPEDT
jgi:hypothetical protein